MKRLIDAINANLIDPVAELWFRLRPLAVAGVGTWLYFTKRTTLDIWLLSLGLGVLVKGQNDSAMGRASNAILSGHSEIDITRPKADQVAISIVKRQNGYSTPAATEGPK